MSLGFKIETAKGDVPPENNLFCVNYPETKLKPAPEKTPSEVLVVFKEVEEAKIVPEKGFEEYFYENKIKYKKNAIREMNKYLIRSKNIDEFFKSLSKYNNLNYLIEKTKELGSKIENEEFNLALKNNMFKMKNIDVFVTALTPKKYQTYIITAHGAYTVLYR